MTRAAIYARFSSSKQREESITDQIRTCSQYAAREGLDIVMVYKDEAATATSTKRRPGFLKMIDDACKGLFDVLIVWKKDRFARNRYDSATYRHKLKKAGVEIVSVCEYIPEGPEGIIMDSFLEGYAEYYSASLAQNVRRGMEGNALECKHNGVSIFGYDLGDDGYYHVNEHEAAGVRLMFKTLADGGRKKDAADALNEGGWRTKRGKKFSVDSVSRMMDTERYLGVYSFGDTVVPDGMPSIVTKREWELAHMNVASSKRKKRSKECAAYLLTGKLFDHEGRRFQSNCGRSCNGAYYYYYRVKETGVSVPRDDVEDRVRRACSMLLEQNPELDNAIVSMVLEEQREDLQTDLDAMDALRKRISDLDREADNLVNLAAMTGPTERIATRLKELESEKPALESELAELESGTPIITEDMIRFFLERLHNCKAPDAIVRGLVDRIDVGEDGSMLVTFTLRRPAKEKAQTRDGEFGKVVCGRQKTNHPKLFRTRGGFAIAA